jgi:hypothetical protein
MQKRTMQPFGRSPLQVLEALKAYQDELDELIGMLPEHEVRRESEAGQELLEVAKQLKTTVNNDMKAMERYESEGKLSDVEERFYAMTIKSMFVSLQPLHLGSRPSRAWMSPLYSAKIDVGHTVAGLRSFIEKSE